MMMLQLLQLAIVNVWLYYVHVETAKLNSVCYICVSSLLGPSTSTEIVVAPPEIVVEIIASSCG